MKISSPLAVLAVLTFSIACQEAATPPPPPTMEEADSAGIRLVTNLEEDRLLAWTFTEIFSVGGEEPDGLSFFRRSADADERGNTYVLDRGNHRVVVFDPEGSQLATLGRQGGGPGEFNIPVGFAVLPDGLVSVYDISKHGLVKRL